LRDGRAIPAAADAGWLISGVSVAAIPSW
jgi:hypothetical protein